MKRPDLLCRLPVLLLFGLPYLLNGCTNHEAGVAKNTTTPRSGPATSIETQLKMIDDNPHMPPQVKEQAKATILNGQNVRPVAMKK